MRKPNLIKVVAPTQSVELEFCICCILIIQFRVKKKSNLITDYFDRKMKYWKSEF